MALFKVENMPTLPDIKHQIHFIHQTPLLRRAKILWILSIVIAICGAIPAYALLNNQSETGTFGILSITNTLATLCMVFTFFYLSKLSLRKRLFVLYAFNFATSAFITLIDYIKFPSPVYELCVLCAAVIVCYLAWHLAKELSFITNDRLFFFGAKIGFVGFLLLIISTAMLSFSDNMLVAVISLGTLAVMLWGAICFLIGIFRLRLIVAYGEDSQNPLK